MGLACIIGFAGVHRYPILGAAPAPAILFSAVVLAVLHFSSIRLVDFDDRMLTLCGVTPEFEDQLIELRKSRGAMKAHRSPGPELPSTPSTAKQPRPQGPEGGEDNPFANFG
jgi:hypothetical protein